VKPRLLLTASAVVLAAGAACFRSLHPPAPAPALSLSSNAASASSAKPAGSAHPAPRAARAVVYVAGEVVRPGVYALAAGARAVDALRAAGGASADADLVAVNLAEPLADGEEIAVPAKGAAGSHDSAPSSSAAASVAPRYGNHRRGRTARGMRRQHGARSHKPPPSEAVDLNHADETSLAELPGIGPRLAGRIVAFRELNGPFASLDDLLDVGGMTDARLQEIAPYAVLR
jgi:competence protein ComEA